MRARSRATPDRIACARTGALQLIVRRQRRLARSVAKAKVAVAIAARAVPGPPCRADVRRIKVRYSRRQERRSRAVSRLMWAEPDRRDDLLHKGWAAVARSAEGVVNETLPLAGLLRGHRIAGSLSEAALGRLVGMVLYKSEKPGGLALDAPRFLPSSKRCACCGAVLDRDGNAAEDLHRLRLAAVADDLTPESPQAWEQRTMDARVRVGLEARARPLW